MAAIVLVRHGVTEATGTRLGGRTPAPLSAEGHDQAERVADRLSSLRVRAVYASPVVRTLETAAPIARRHGLEVEELPGVTEFEYGRWTDQPLRSLRRTKLWADIVRVPSRVTFPEGETFRAAQARAVDAVEEIAARHTDRQTVIVVSHADVIKAIVAHYVGVPLDLFQRLVVGPASVSVLNVPRRGQPALLRFNDTGNLG